MSTLGPPLHVVPASPGHGVVRIARQLAAAVGAAVVDLRTAMTLPATPAHVHVTDRLFGASAETAETALAALLERHPSTVTLHDVPQAGEGVVFDRRARVYASVIARSRGWVVSSEHEAGLVASYLSPPAPGTVVPLPVLSLPGGGVVPAVVEDLAPGGRVVGVLGWIYPGKGHAEVIRACTGLQVTVRAVGRVSPGHEDLLDELRALAAGRGVGLETTGWVSDADLARQLAAVDVPVAVHRHVSASGSINSWTSARRRPLVTAGAYAAEMALLRPGTLTLVDDADLPARILGALADPASTRLPDTVRTAPHLDDCAQAYLDFWARR